MPVQITPEVIAALQTNVQLTFNKTLAATTTPMLDALAQKVKSSSKQEAYPFLGAFPALKEWIGERSSTTLQKHGFTIVNKLWANSIDIPRTEIEDDTVGLYGNTTREFARQAKISPETWMLKLLKEGTTGLCYDGKPFFASDHPIYPNSDGTGTAENVSNFIQAATDPGKTWYLVDASRFVKPMIWQERLAPEIDNVINPDNPSVFLFDMYKFGVRMRGSVGYGLWQLAIASNEDLTPESFRKAYAAMAKFKADGGELLTVRPTHLIVPSDLEAAGETIVSAAIVKQGNVAVSNINVGKVKLFSSPYLD